MVLHKVSTQNVRPYCRPIANSLTNCFTMWAMAEISANSQTFGIGMREKTELTKGSGS